MHRPTRIAVALALVGLAASAALRRAGAQTADSVSIDRWQIMRADGSYLWDLHLVRLSGDTLVVRQADTLVKLPLAVVDEMRLVQQFEQKGPGGQRSVVAGLAGADDAVLKLTLYTVAERRRLIEELLRARAAAREPDR